MKRNIRSLKMFSSVQIRFLFIRCESFFSSGASLQQTGRTAFNQSTSGSAPPGESGPLVRRSEENSIHDSRRGMVTQLLCALTVSVSVNWTLARLAAPAMPNKHIWINTTKSRI